MKPADTTMTTDMNEGNTMKLFLQSLGLAVVLFFYGYLLSTAGHDHSAHQHNGSHTQVEQEDHHDNSEQDHDHSRH